MIQTPTQQIDRMEAHQTCVSFGRLDPAKPFTDESVQIHSEEADKTAEMELKRPRFEES